MITKFIPINVVISKIVTDLGLGEKEIAYQNFVEWIVSGLKYIGVDYQYITKEVELKVENYQVTLPCDFSLFSRVLFLENKNTTMMNRNPDLQQEEFFNQDNRISKLDYKIENNRIITSFPKGSITLQYKAIPSDEEGLPLIPDLIEYETALFWRVVYQLNIYGYQFKNPALMDILFVQQQWRDYCAQARGAGNMPDLPTLERMKNNWLRLYDHKDDFSERFVNAGQKEHRRLD